MSAPNWLTKDVIINYGYLVGIKNHKNKCEWFTFDNEHITVAHIAEMLARQVVGCIRFDDEVDLRTPVGNNDNIYIRTRITLPYCSELDQFIGNEVFEHYNTPESIEKAKENRKAFRNYLESILEFRK